MTDETVELTQEELRDATVWRLVRAMYLDAICRLSGRIPALVSDEQANELLEPHMKQMQRYFEVVCECMLNAKMEGASQISEKYHESAVKNFDSHEYLDQILVDSRRTDYEEVPLMEHPRHQADKP